MSASAVLLGFLNVCLTVAIIVLIAYIILWVLTALFGFVIDANVYKWGRIVVALFCIIVIVSWLLSLLGAGPSIGPHFLGRW